MPPRRAAPSQFEALRRGLTFLGPKGILLWALLLVGLQSVAYGLAAVTRGLEFQLLAWMVMAAMTLAWLLALSPLSAKLAAPLGVILGFQVILLRVGRLFPQIWAVLRAGGIFLRELLLWYWNGPPDWGRVPAAWFTLWQDTGALLARGWIWLRALFLGAGVYDPIATALVWSAVLWACAFWAGWWVRRRHRPLTAILPGGALLAAALSYTNAGSTPLLVLVSTTLLLLALMQFRERELRWMVANIDFSRDLWSDVLTMATALTLAVMLIAAVAPSVSATALLEWIRETFPSDNRGLVAESLGLEQRPVLRPLTPLERAASTELPRQHLIGSGPELRQIVVMLVSTDDDPAAPPRYYWRSLIYDIYLGRGWGTSRAEIARYAPNEPVNRADVAHHRLVQQQIHNLSDANIVQVAGTLVSLNEPYDAAVRHPNDFFAATTSATSYQAASIVPVVTEELLQESGVVYPLWIRERYLQLPDSTPERVLALARDLTATAVTPYDRARAIERYLRQFPYTLNVPVPGYEEDIADYFLFNLQRGYCDYYATTMVVLARAVGVPARMVVGYASGDYDADNARYIVTEANAHAWVEVYFPGVGWVTFEPTGGLPEIGREKADSELIWPEPRDPVEADVPEAESAARALQPARWAAATAGAALVAGVLALGLDWLILLRRPPRETLTRLYHRLTRQAARLHVATQPGDTPRELTAAFTRRLQALAERRPRLAPFLAPAVDEARALAAGYERAWYTPQLPGVAEQRAAVALWGKLRWRLWLAGLGERRLKRNM